MKIMHVKLCNMPHVINSASMNRYGVSMQILLDHKPALSVGTRHVLLTWMLRSACKLTWKLRSVQVSVTIDSVTPPHCIPNSIEVCVACACWHERYIKLASKHECWWAPPHPHHQLHRSMNLNQGPVGGNNHWWFAVIIMSSIHDEPL